MGFFSRPATRRMRRLSALLPGLISTPEAPPLSAASLESRRSPLICWAAPWQTKQRLARSGSISRAKSILVLAAGGRSCAEDVAADTIAAHSRTTLSIAIIIFPGGEWVKWTPPLPSRSGDEVYLPWRETLLFQSRNAPWGLPRHAQTCSSKGADKPYRFGLGTNWNDCPSSTGGLVWLASHGSARTTNSTPTSCRAPPDNS